MYYPHRQRQDNNSFEGNYNIGANVIMDVLRRRGFECNFCTPDTANKFKIVLVSFTSDYDCLAFYKSVSLLSHWQRNKRSFVVVAGGEGIQNPTTIRNYLDYAVFGRAENIIYDLIDTVMGGNIFQHESVMNLPELHEVKLAQANELYPYEIDLGRGRVCRIWNETFIGCPNKCKFCHYTWSRKWIGGDTYYQGNLTMNRSVEILWKDIQRFTEKQGRIRTAIDGFSQRLRFAYGKHISNEEIIEGINHIGSFDGNTVLMVYNISNMPHETQSDKDELYLTIKKANPKHRVIFVLQSTPFRPSLLTPLMWSPVTLFPMTSDLSAKVIYNTDNLRAIHSFSNESAYSQLETVIVSRATKETDKLFHTICFHPKLKSGNARDKIKLLQNTFDLSQYLKSYDISEPHPAWFLRSFTNINALWKQYIKAESIIDTLTI
jgi:radical SAM superfamily enzyme YgiQ (UPF0313 family)